MSEDIKDQVIDELKSACPFALQLYESTDVSSCAQLIAFERYIHERCIECYNGVIKDDSFCRPEHVAKIFIRLLIDDLAFVRNLYLIADADLVSMFNGDDITQEELIALKSDSITEDVFKEKTLSAYWSAIVPCYPRVSNAAI